MERSVVKGILFVFQRVCACVCLWLPASIFFTVLSQHQRAQHEILSEIDVSTRILL